MTPEQEIADLDRFIDTLQAGVASDIDDGVETGLADLANTVLELRRLAEPGWPDDDYPAIAAAHIAEVLRARTASYKSSSRGPMPLNGHAPALSDDAQPYKLAGSRHHRRWFKEIGQMAAAALTLVLVVGLLALLLGNVDGSRFGRGSSQPATGTSSQNLGAASAQGEEILFTSKRSGTYQIYAVKADGSGLHQLTNGPEDNIAPSWSPDGTKIAFFRTNGIPDAHPPLPIGVDASGRVYVMNADGSDMRSLTPNGRRDYEDISWSPDGTQLAAQCDGNVQICVYDVDRAGVSRVLPSDLLGGGITWSPDGRWIAFIGEQSSAHKSGIYLVSPDGAQLRTVQQDNDHDSSLSWSPNGNQIAYIHGIEENKLTLINVDGSDPHDLDAGNRFPSDVRWSPDGSKLLFLSQSPQNSFSGLSVIDADGTGIRDIFPTSAEIFTAVWSPDGQAIAVTRGVISPSLATPGGESLHTELDVVRLDGSPAQTVFKETDTNPGDGWPPSWQPLVTNPAAPRPTTQADMAAGRVYLQAGNSVDVLDAISGQLIHQLPLHLATQSVFLATDRSGQQLFVTDAPTQNGKVVDELTVYNTADWSVEQQIPVPDIIRTLGEGSGIAASTDGQYVYVYNYNDRTRGSGPVKYWLATLDVASGKWLAQTVDLPNCGVSQLMTTDLSGLVYIRCADTGDLRVVDPIAGRVVRSIASIASVTVQGQSVYAVSADGSVQNLDSASGSDDGTPQSSTTSADLNVPVQPVGVTPDGSEMFIPSGTDAEVRQGFASTIAVVDVHSGVVMRTIRVSQTFRWAVFSSDGSAAYLDLVGSNGDSQAFTRLDLNTGQETTLFQGQVAPNIVVAP